MKNQYHIFNLLLAFIPMSLLSIGCNSKHSEGRGVEQNEIDTLKVVTLYSPLSYFHYRGDTLGIDYENVKKFARDEGLPLQIRTVNNIRELIDALKTGEAHLAAFPVPKIAEYTSDAIFCGVPEISRQVLVQKNSAEKISDVTQLIDKDIYVEANSKYDYRIKNLNDELGGGIKIHSVAADTIIEEDFLEKVNKGEIDYTIVDSQIADLYKTSFPHLDTSLALSADQWGSWAVAPGLDSLAANIDRWENRTHSTEFLKEIYKKYYDNAQIEDFNQSLQYFKNLNPAKNKRISAYDEYFKKYASTSGYDWKLLAAIAYCESRYMPDAISAFGARGLMQVMPSSAAAMGVDPSLLSNPESNVLAASRIVQQIDKSFKNKVEDPDERIKFVLAAYNSGSGHIFDAISLAEKLGLNPQKWTGNVSVAALMKSRPEYYNDPVVKHGYFRGRETVDFVERVTGIYNYLKNNIKE